MRGGDNRGPQNGQKARQHHHVDAVAAQGIQQSRVKLGAGGVVLAADHSGLHTGLFGPLQGVDPGAAGHYQLHPAMGVLPPGLAVQDSLEIGAASRHQHGYLQHISTPFSPLAISPMM